MPDAILPTHQEYIIDRLFPAREVSVIAGPSGAGKTRLMLQMIWDWSQGKPVFGRPSHPTPWVYVSCDRSRAGVLRVLDDLALPFPESNMIFALDRGIENIDQLMLEAKKLLPDGGTLWVEALQWLAPEARGSNKIVGRFMNELVRHCQGNNFTLPMSAHTPKAKRNEEYAEPRQRVSGPMAWAGAAETIILVERMEPEDASDTRRRVFILPRNGPEESLTYEMDSKGHMIPFIGKQGEDSVSVLDVFLASLRLGEPFCTGDLKKKGKSDGAVSRWLKRMIHCGLVRQVGYGQFERTETN